MGPVTDVGYRRRTVDVRPAKPKVGRTQITSVGVITASVAALRPVMVAGAIITAAVMWGPRAHADMVGDALGDVGIGNNGPVSDAIAQIGTSICPLLVQPGSQMASTATQMSGQGGIAPPVAGFVTQMAIQSQCPAFMTALANGDIPTLMRGGIPASPLSVPGMGGLPEVTPFGVPGDALPGLPGAPAPAPAPMQLAGSTPSVPAVPGL